jgi:hypothetical protein
VSDCSHTFEDGEEFVVRNMNLIIPDDAPPEAVQAAISMAIEIAKQQMAAEGIDPDTVNIEINSNRDLVHVPDDIRELE